MTIRTSSPWWEDATVTANLNFTFVNGTQTPQVDLDADMDNSNIIKPTTFIGPLHQLSWLASYLKHGYKLQYTRGDGRCGIWALQISLKPIYESFGLIPPSFERLEDICHSQKVRNMFQNRADWRQEGDEEELGFGTNFHEWFQLSATLRILGEIDDISFGLGVLSVSKENKIAYEVQIDAPVTKPGVAQETDWDGIVWIHHDGNIHWSGVAPGSDKPIIRPSGQRKPIDSVTPVRRNPPITEPTMNGSFSHSPTNRHQNNEHNIQWVGPTRQEDPEKHTQVLNRPFEGLFSPPSASTSSSTYPFDELPSFLPDNAPSTSYPFDELPSFLPDDTPIITNVTRQPDQKTQQNYSKTPSYPHNGILDHRDNVANKDTSKTEPHGPPHDQVDPPYVNFYHKRNRQASHDSPNIEFNRGMKKARTDFSPLKDPFARRKSHEMEVDPAMSPNGENQAAMNQVLTHEEKELSQQLGLSDNLINGRHIRELGTGVQDWQKTNVGIPLYEDVQGNIPGGHQELNENDAQIGPWKSSQYAQRYQDAERKKKRPILSAPEWFQDIPWNDIQGISIEEFIIYFPNHAARWPGIALYIRCLDWDRLFYRVARLINLSRGTHRSIDPERASIQVLPLMMKMEQAIRQFNGDYKIKDHPQVPDDFIMQHIKLKPADFPTHPKRASVFEADGYVAQWVHEFEDRPFSRRMINARPTGPRFSERASRGVTLDNFPFQQYDVGNSDWNSPRHQSTKMDEDIWIQMASESPQESRDDGPSSHSQSSFEDFDDLEVESISESTFNHLKTQFATSRAVKSEQNTHKAGQTKSVGIQVCRYDRRCANADCPRAHRGPATHAKVAINTEVSPCRFSLRCNNTDCDRSHPSPAGQLERRKGSNGDHDGSHNSRKTPRKHDKQDNDHEKKTRGGKDKTQSDKGHQGKRNKSNKGESNWPDRNDKGGQNKRGNGGSKKGSRKRDNHDSNAL